MSNSDEIREFVQSQDLSIDPRVKIEGPWAFRGLDGYRAPIYIYLLTRYDRSPLLQKQSGGGRITSKKRLTSFILYSDIRAHTGMEGCSQFVPQLTS